jgi:ubiquinol-cytochrome c reductase cytochrome b subunit
MIIHLILLHEKGSSNPNNTKTETDKMKFHPSFSVKDLLPGTLIAILFMLMISNTPNLLGDVENFNPANPLVTPVHIQPEWYFLFAYVILRSIPSKLGGVVALAASIIILAVLVIKKNVRTKFNPIKKTVFWLFSSTVLILT